MSNPEPTGERLRAAIDEIVKLRAYDEKLRDEPIGHHRLMALSDDELRTAYLDTVEFGREAGNQPPIYRRLQSLAGELERRGLERPR